VVQVSARDEGGPQLTSGAEHRLVDRASGRAELSDVGVQSYAIHSYRNEDLALSWRQLMLDGGADRG